VTRSKLEEEALFPLASGCDVSDLPLPKGVRKRHLAFPSSLVTHHRHTEKRIYETGKAV
jgi:hypothetical protein